jgi:hypothetical protein
MDTFIPISTAMSPMMNTDMTYLMVMAKGILMTTTMITTMYPSMDMEMT